MENLLIDIYLFVCRVYATAPAPSTSSTVGGSKPRFHKQKTTYSRVPACLRMVLSGFGLQLTEERPRDLCDCSPLFGTDALRAVDAARGLDFAGIAKYTLRYDESQSLVRAASTRLLT